MASNNYIIDEFGKWEVADNGAMFLIKPSQKWLDEHPAPEPTPEPVDRVAVLESQAKQLTAQISALETQNSTLEECIVEMAGVVYA